MSRKGRASGESVFGPEKFALAQGKDGHEGSFGLENEGESGYSGPCRRKIAASTRRTTPAAKPR